RNALTTLSADLDRVGASPYVWDASDAAMAGTTYKLTPGAKYPTGAAISFPSTSTRATATPRAATEFGGDWRRTWVNKARLNLNDLSWLKPYAQTQFISYPAPGMTGLIDTTDANLTLAIQQRQTLAKEIYQRLLAATGAQHPDTAAMPPVSAPGTPEYDA